MKGQPRPGDPGPVCGRLVPGSRLVRERGPILPTFHAFALKREQIQGGRTQSLFLPGPLLPAHKQQPSTGTGEGDFLFKQFVCKDGEDAHAELHPCQPLGLKWSLLLL